MKQIENKYLNVINIMEVSNRTIIQMEVYLKKTAAVIGEEERQ